MILFSNVPLLKGTQTGWERGGDPIPAPDSRCVLIPYPVGSQSVLDVDENGRYRSVPLDQAGPSQWLQLRGNFLECERAGAIVILCIPGLT